MDKQWGSAATPVSVGANVSGQVGVGLYCLAGTPPGIMLQDRGTAPVELVASGRAHRATSAPIDAFEQKMMGDVLDKKGTALLRFEDPKMLLTALRGAAGEVRVTRGDTLLAGGKPLDALLRWASQCEKLQSQPRPKI